MNNIEINVNIAVFHALKSLEKSSRPLFKFNDLDNFVETHNLDMVIGVLRISQNAARNKLREFGDYDSRTKHETEDAAYNAAYTFIKKARTDGKLCKKEIGAVVFQKVSKKQARAVIVKAYILASDLVPQSEKLKEKAGIKDIIQGVWGLLRLLWSVLC